MRPASARPNAPRPSSSLSVRPPSRSSQRPGSSLSVRSIKWKHAPRLVTFTQQLVTVVNRISTGAPQFDAKVDETLKALDSARNFGPSQDRIEIERRVHGLARKARVNMQDDWADALERCYDALSVHLKENKDSGDMVKESNMPEILQFLLALSHPVDASTRYFAEDYMEKLNAVGPASDRLVFEKIMMEEPFEGQHWEGAYGPPIGWTAEGYETMVPSSPSDSSFDDWSMDSKLVRNDKSDTSTSPIPHPSTLLVTSDDSMGDEESRMAMVNARIRVDALIRSQYWRKDAKLIETRAFDLGIPSTLGPTICRIVDKAEPSAQKYILEVQAVREMLFLLQGNKTIFFHTEFSEDSMSPLMELASDAPRLRHLSPKSLHSILNTFKSRSQSLYLLRHFYKGIYASGRSPESARRQGSRTLEAFAAAVEDFVLQFDCWCAAKEESLCKSAVGQEGPILASLLNLERETRMRLGDTLDCLIKIVGDLRSRRPLPSKAELGPFDLSSIHPTVLSKLILDSLLLVSRRKLADGDEKCSTELLTLFIRTSEPLWRSIGSWLKRGADISDVPDCINIDASGRTDFFIHRQDVPVAAAVFWSHGYTLCSSTFTGRAEFPAEDETVVPQFLANIALDLLAAGKSVGLLKSLDVVEFFTDEGAEYEWLQDWPTLKDMIRMDVSPLVMSAMPTSLPLPDIMGSGGSAPENDTSILRSMGSHYTTSQLTSVDSLASLIQERLLPWCQLAQFRLTREIVKQCGLRDHLHNIAALFLGQRGDAMTLLCDILVDKIRQNAVWTDYHFLNSTFRRVALSTPEVWIDPDAVRVSYRGVKREVKFESVRQLEGLSVEYQVPFPLTYMLGPSENEAYSSILIMLLQLRLALSAVHRIHISEFDKMMVVQTRPDLMKLFYSLRARLIWLITTIATHFITNIIHSELLRFDEEMDLTQSFDSIIEIHNDHLSRLRNACFLTPETSSVHKGLISILDLALHFADLQMAALGESTPVALSRRTVRFSSRKKRRLNRRQKQLRSDVVAFTVPMVSDSEDEGAEEREEAEILREMESAAANENEDDNGALTTVGITSRTMDDITLQTSMALSVGEEDIDFEGRIAKMDREVDVLVRYLSRRIEELSNGNFGAVESFAKLAFALDDWDL